jgi:hypothetical protein
MDSPHIPDIVAFLEAAGRWVGDELNIEGLAAGDRLLVRTQNTRYLFVMNGQNRAELSSDRPDRPSGPVRIQGCVFGQSRMIKPNHLFCGGALEIIFDRDRHTFTTSPIQDIQLVKTDRSPTGSAPHAAAGPEQPGTG